MKKLVILMVVSMFSVVAFANPGANTTSNASPSTTIVKKAKHGKKHKAKKEKKAAAEAAAPAADAAPAAPASH